MCGRTGIASARTASRRPRSANLDSAARASLVKPTPQTVTGEHRRRAMSGTRENETIRTAAEALLAKLAEVEQATLGVFTFAKVHGCSYTGPNYGPEKAALQAALESSSPPAEAGRARHVEVEEVERTIQDEQ